MMPPLKSFDDLDGKERGQKKTDDLRAMTTLGPRTLIPILHVAHDAKSFFALCIPVFSSRTIRQFILSQKCQHLGCMSIR